MRAPILLGCLVLIAAPASGRAAGPALSPDGYGDLKIGMRERDAVRRFHLHVARDDGVSSFECREDAWPGHRDIWVMAQNGRITRITVGRKVPRTDKGVGVGSTEADVKRAYGPSLKVSRHAYEEAPAHYLDAWTVKGRRGVRFETDKNGVVTSVHAGDKSIELIEGCL